MPLQALTHLLDGRNVQRIVGDLACYHLRRQRQTQRIQRREHHFELRQVLAVGPLL